MSLHVTVTSSARNAEKYAARCISSVREQTFRNWQHIFIDAASEDGTADAARHAAGNDPRVHVVDAPARLDALRNLLPVWRSLDPSEIIVWVDGDDSLLIDRALEFVVAEHERGAWVTYGNFVGTDGSLGFAAPMSPLVPPRKQPWLATHLKSFRAGLVQATPAEYFDHHGGAWDQSLMLAACELAGFERCTYINRLLYLYTWEHSAELNWTAEQKKREHADVMKIRAMPQLKALERLA